MHRETWDGGMSAAPERRSGNGDRARVDILGERLGGVDDKLVEVSERLVKGDGRMEVWA